MVAPTTQNNAFEQARREHAELNRLLEAVAACLAARSDPAGRVGRLLLSLVRQVTAHFQQEETGGFFDQVVRRAPRLSTRADHLRFEHEKLLELVRRLAELCREPSGGSPDWDALGRAFDDLRRQLDRHEHDENLLLQEAYSQDIGAED